MTEFHETHPPRTARQPAQRRAEHPHSRYAIDCAGAWLYVHARSLATVLRVDGEIDAANAKLVGQTLRGFSRLNAPLIIDLSDLDFLGIAGFRELLDLNQEHERTQLRYSVVAGAALHRLTRVFTDHALPLVDTVLQGLHQIDEEIQLRRLFVSRLARQLEPQSRIPLIRRAATEN